MARVGGPVESDSLRVLAISFRLTETMDYRRGD